MVRPHCPVHKLALQLGATPACHHYIGGLDVPVVQALGVDALHCLHVKRHFTARPTCFSRRTTKVLTQSMHSLIKQKAVGDASTMVAAM